MNLFKKIITQSILMKSLANILVVVVVVVLIAGSNLADYRYLTSSASTCHQGYNISFLYVLSFPYFNSQ